MTDRHDIEETLKRFRHDPDARVKRAAMAAYHESSGAMRPRRHGFWHRPVPMYAAAAVLVIVMGASFLAGQRSAPTGERAVADVPAPAADGAVTTVEVEWSAAESDLL